jgi:hypothetical protein
VLDAVGVKMIINLSLPAKVGMREVIGVEIGEAPV